MGIGSSSRFKRDAEFLIGCPSRQARLQKLITKQASKILTTNTSFSLLASLARVGDCSGLLCALQVTRCANESTYEHMTHIFLSGGFSPATVLWFGLIFCV